MSNAHALSFEQSDQVLCTHSCFIVDVVDEGGHVYGGQHMSTSLVKCKIATHDTHWFATHGLRYQTFVFDSKAGVWGK